MSDMMNELINTNILEITRLLGLINGNNKHPNNFMNYDIKANTLEVIIGETYNKYMGDVFSDIEKYLKNIDSNLYTITNTDEEINVKMTECKKCDNFFSVFDNDVIKYCHKCGKKTKIAYLTEKPRVKTFINFKNVLNVNHTVYKAINDVNNASVVFDDICPEFDIHIKKLHKINNKKYYKNFEDLEKSSAYAKLQPLHYTPYYKLERFIDAEVECAGGCDCTNYGEKYFKNAHFDNVVKCNYCNKCGSKIYIKYVIFECNEYYSVNEIGLKRLSKNIRPSDEYGLNEDVFEMYV